MCICEEHLCQISSRSDLKQRSYRLLWRRCPNKNNKIRDQFLIERLEIASYYRTRCRTLSALFIPIIYSTMLSLSVSWCDWTVCLKFQVFRSHKYLIAWKTTLPRKLLTRPNTSVTSDYHFMMPCGQISVFNTTMTLFIWNAKPVIKNKFEFCLPDY